MQNGFIMSYSFYCGKSELYALLAFTDDLWACQPHQPKNRIGKLRFVPFLLFGGWLKQQKDATAYASKKAHEDAINQWWAKAKRYYDQEVLYLYSALKDKSKDHKDSIETTPGYFECLPQNPLPQYVETPLAEIRFKKETNICFAISIKDDTSEQRPLRTSCECGRLEIHPTPGFKNIDALLKVPDLEDTYHLEIDENHNFTNDVLSALIESQIEFVKTNK